MDELEISGKRYLSSKRAAEIYKYHSDYIGQLVRGKKVVGQKVGRAWYVEADSLAEYLEKEIPPRGPIVNKIKSEPEATSEPVVNVALATKEESGGSGEELVAEPVEVRDSSLEPEKVEAKMLDQEPIFEAAFRKYGRQHVIAAIDADEVIEKIEAPTVVEKTEPVVEDIEEAVAEEPQQEKAVEAEKEEVDEEENFIPVKITQSPAVERAEDSFYKVSSKGLRYIAQSAPLAGREKQQEIKKMPVAEAAPRAVRVKTGKQYAYAGVISTVFAAGIVSLGAGVLLSYYLYSITSIEGQGQTSSVILGN